MEHSISCSLFLIGFMGTGKSTVAGCLQKKLSMDVVEMDQEIERREGMPIPEIFERYGEARFREAETELLTEMQTDVPRIVSCGGGAALREENVRIMKRTGKIVLLTARPETILERVQNDENRPLLKDGKTVEHISAMLKQRREKYEAAADIVIPTDKKSIEAICREIIEKLGA